MSEPASGELRLELVPAAADGRALLRCGGNDGIESTAEASGELPFADRTIASIRLGGSVAQLQVRDRVQLLLECRRMLLPGGRIVLEEPEAAATFAAMARWAALVGLDQRHRASAAPGWEKHADGTDAAPLVSILIPSSNPRYFLECLDSALAQTYSNVEIIVSDDSEGDAIEAMTRSRSARAPIEFHRNVPRLGTRRNYETLLTLARGEYVKFLNDDDVLAPDCVARLLRPMLEIPDLALATSHRQPIDARSRALPDMPATRPVVDEDLVVSGVSLANAAIMYGLNIIGEPTTMLLRKRDFMCRPEWDADGPYHFNGAHVRGAIDLAMASRALVQGNAAYISARLSSFRLHGEQAQARPDVVARSVDGIRGLQHQWVELGLFRRVHPNVLETRRIASARDAGIGWRPYKVLSFTNSANPPEVDLRRWRETRRHPFDFAAG